MLSARIGVRQCFSSRPLPPFSGFSSRPLPPFSGARGHGDIARRQKHGFPTRAVSSEMNYIDKRFESIVKPKCFYEKHADGAVRRYFYNIDLQGRLFLGMYEVVGCSACCNSEFHSYDSILIVQRRHYQRILRPR